jgi:hypothetical protein
MSGAKGILWIIATAKVKRVGHRNLTLFNSSSANR